VLTAQPVSRRARIGSTASSVERLEPPYPGGVPWHDHVAANSAKLTLETAQESVVDVVDIGLADGRRAQSWQGR
jgi:hypothetical protein